jgi:hypothetical protein
MPAALRRGVAHYQGGSESVSPDDAAFVADRAASYNAGRGVQTITSAAPAAPAASAAPSGVGQLFTGDFAGARDNPASSPLTSTLGQFADYLSRSTRAQQAAAGPSLKDWTANLFAGDRASTAALTEHADAAKQLKDPLVQQYLVSNPDQLAIAEKDPRGYAAVSTDPNFRQKMALAVGAHVDAAANDKVTHAEHPKVVSGAVDNNVTSAQSHAALAPHKYTEDEFVKLFSGMPMKQVAMLFGQQMGRVRTPQEKAATEVFDVLHGNFAKANDTVKRMEAEIAEATKNRVSSPHTQAGGFGFGTSPYDAAKAERDKAYSITMDALKSFIGITSKPYPMPGQPGG